MAKIKGVEAKGTDENPFHTSVGIVLVQDGKIAILKKAKGPYKGKHRLPAETYADEETDKETAKRGALEELGLPIKPGKFIGGVINHFRREGGKKEIEKTTRYWTAEVDEEKEKTVKTPTPDEKKDKLFWLPLPDAKRILEQEQSDERKILERV